MITLTPRTRAATKGALVPIAQIDFPANARPAHADKVGELVKSIRLLGLQSMPTVIERNGRYMLVAGRHRVEAMRVVGKDPIPVRVADFDDVEARLWAISENLHRTELTALERAEQITEFARLTKERLEAQEQAPVDQVGQKTPQGVLAQVAPKPQGGRPEGGDRLVARKLGASPGRKSGALGQSPIFLMIRRRRPPISGLTETSRHSSTQPKPRRPRLRSRRWSVAPKAPRSRLLLGRRLSAIWRTSRRAS
jgi:hypothetical protein